MFDVVLYTHTGMRVPLCEREDVATCKSRVRGYLRYCRRIGHPVYRTGKGRWEVEGRDNAWMVSDREGTLVVRRAKRRTR